VLHYLARYTHRVAISNHRLIGMEDGKVTFRWKDYEHGGKRRKMTLAAEEFIRRFLLHVLPKGLVRIRYYGWMANRLRRECAAEFRALDSFVAAKYGMTPMKCGVALVIRSGMGGVNSLHAYEFVLLRGVHVDNRVH